MADVTEAFIRGHQAAQNEAEHDQALADSKLRQQILKHQMDELKINDQLRKRELDTQNYQLMNGRDISEMPTEQVPGQVSNLESRSLAGAQTAPQPAAASMGQPGDAAGSTVAAPPAQATEPETHAGMVTRPQAMTISGVPALGVADTQVRPRSLQELVQAQIAEEMAKPYNLGPGQRRFLGGKQIATGGPRIQSVGAGGAISIDPETNEVSTVAEGRPRAASEYDDFKNNIYPQTFRRTTFDELTPQQKAGVAAAYHASRRDPTVANDRENNARFRQMQTGYSDYITLETRKHASDTRKTIEANKNLPIGQDAKDLPDFNPMSQTEWARANGYGDVVDMTTKRGGGTGGTGGGAPRHKISVSPDGLTVTVDGTPWTVKSKQDGQNFIKELGGQ